MDKGINHLEFLGMNTEMQLGHICMLTHACMYSSYKECVSYILHIEKKYIFYATTHI